LICFLCTAILGFTGLINQVQYHAAVADKGQSTNSGGWNGMMNKKIKLFEFCFSFSKLRQKANH
jgi:hypothetical protein